MAELRLNRVKQKLEEGGIVSVPMGPNTPELFEYMAQLDFDGLWIEAEHGSLTVKVAQVDVASAESCADCFTQYADELAQVTALINNAGLARGLTTFQDSNFVEWDEMIDTNI